MTASRPETPLDSAGRTNGEAAPAQAPAGARVHGGGLPGEGIEEALHRALRLTETGEGEDALRRAEGEGRSALKLAIPPRIPPTGAGVSPRPALQSVQSSFATTYSSRSPASRTTSNTSIISVHESIPTTASIAPKSAPHSPYMYPYSPSNPSSPNMRWTSQMSAYGPPSRSPSIASESAYPHLSPFHLGASAAPHPAYHATPYPVGPVPYAQAQQGMPMRPSSASAPFAHPGPQASSQVAFTHPFAGVDPAYVHHVNPPYGQPPNWQPAPVPAARPIPPPNGRSSNGATVYDESGAPIPSAAYAYGQPYGPQPVYLYPQQAVAGGFAYPYPYPSAPVGAPGTAGYPHVPLAPAPVPQRYPSDPLSSGYSNPAQSSPYPPQAALPARQDTLHYPISSARSSVSSLPSTAPSWPGAGPHVGQPVVVLPLPPPPIPHPTRPSLSTGLPATLPTSPYHPRSPFGALPTVGESQHSSGERTSLGSPAVGARVSFARISPPDVSPPGVSPTRSSIPFGASPGEQSAGPFGRRGSNLPRPPTHSPHALWVGNVPSDASHAELWQFFQTRPTPRMCGVVLSPDASPRIDLDSNGVESIHLIARSNCAFVNYLTPLHLRHAIAVSNNVSLRPDDTRAKKLVCRVRAPADDSRTGVGAQRLGGMHKAFVREQQARMAEAQREIVRRESERSEEEGEESAREGGRESAAPLSPGSEERQEREMSLASIKSGSTTSSFLAKHFERRYFILKSHNEQDLRRAVETGSWATQAHNEPVLHQAFRTARSVYLIFGVNGSGCWFGYARMVGPIASQASSTGSSRLSLSSRAERSSTSTELRLSSASQTILEEPEQGVSPLEVLAARTPVISPSEHRFAAQSPQQVTPSPSGSAPLSYAGRLASGLSGRGFTPLASPAAPGRTPTHAQGGGSAPATLARHRPPTGDIPLAAQRAMSREQDLAARETADRLHLPPAAAEAARRAASLESGMPQRAREVLEARASSTGARREGEEDEEGKGDSPRKELIAKAAEARNARLEVIETAKEAKVPSPAGTATERRPSVARAASWGSPFAIEWIKVETLPFSRTRHIRNSFNGNREIKVSRDGTEVEPAAGELLLGEWWRSAPAAEGPRRPASPQPVLAGEGAEAERLLRAEVLKEKDTAEAGAAGAAARV
ncbi:hypothetical protein JCM10450v2_007983 [Rhodotorula kratochvilovae]